MINLLNRILVKSSVLSRMKLFKIFLCIFLFCMIKVDSEENNYNLDNLTITIIQKSKYDFEYIKNNRYLVNYNSIINALKDVPEAQKLYIKAHNGFIGASVSFGMGIGISVFSGLFLFSSTIIYSTKGYMQNNLGSTLGLAIGSGSGLLLGLSLLISGLIYRNEYKLKKVNAVRIYNLNKIKLLSFVPYLNIDKNFNVITGLFLICKI